MLERPRITPPAVAGHFGSHSRYSGYARLAPGLFPPPGMNWTLQTPTAFSLTAVIDSHGWSQLDPFRRLEPAGLSCVMNVPRRKPVEISVRQPRRSLSVTASATLSERHRKYVDDRLRWMLGLDVDLEAFYRAARSEQKLSHAQEKRYGRFLRSPSFFEDITKTILTTNTTWAGTKRMVSRLVESFGVQVHGPDGPRAFPLPGAVASVPVDALRKDVGLGYRAPYISELASAVLSGTLDLDSLRDSDLSTAELRRSLLAIKGVGPYAAATLMMLLGRYDFLPIDSWAFKLVSTEFHGGEPVGKPEVEAAFQKWGEWKALAYWFWDWELLRQKRQ